MGQRSRCSALFKNERKNPQQKYSISIMISFQIIIRPLFVFLEYNLYDVCRVYMHIFNDKMYAACADNDSSSLLFVFCFRHHHTHILYSNHHSYRCLLQQQTCLLEFPLISHERKEEPSKLQLKAISTFHCNSYHIMTDFEDNFWKTS